MLAKLLVVDNPTAGLAMKAYANLGLKEHWRSVGLWLCCPALVLYQSTRWQCLFAGTNPSSLRPSLLSLPGADSCGALQSASYRLRALVVNRNFTCNTQPAPPLRRFVLGGKNRGPYPHVR